MITATLNGQDGLPVPGLGRIQALVDDGMGCVIVEMRDGERIWTSEPIALRPEPTRTRSDSRTGDYLAVVWVDARVFVIYGDPNAVVLSLESGAILTTFRGEFIGKESLEQAALHLSDDGQFLTITSTKLLWVVDRALRVVLRYEPRFLFAEPPSLTDRSLHVTEFDFDNDAETLFSHVLPL